MLLLNSPQCPGQPLRKKTFLLITGIEKNLIQITPKPSKIKKKKNGKSKLLNVEQQELIRKLRLVYERSYSYMS